jgi:type II secretory pathway component PulF
MARFRYTVLDPSGRSLKGLIEAQTRDEAVRTLDARGQVAVNISELGQWRRLLDNDTPSRLELADFLDDLAALHRAGVPLRRALDVLCGDAVAPRVAKLARLMADRLDSGAELGVAARVGDAGDVVLAAELAKAGEASGRLDATLTAGANVLRRQAEFVKRIRGALAYPLFLLVMCVFAIMSLSLIAGPALAPILEEAPREKVAALRLVLSMGSVLRHHLIWVILGSGAIVVGIAIALRQAKVQFALSVFRARVPVVRLIVRDLNCGAFAQTFGTLVAGGTPAAKAIDLASATANNRYWRQTLRASAERLREGRTIAGALAAISQAPSELTHLTAVGEETGALGEMTIRAGDIILERALRRLDQAAAVAGPLLLVTMGGFIAWVMSAFLGGLSSLGDGFL